MQILLIHNTFRKSTGSISYTSISSLFTHTLSGAAGCFIIISNNLVILSVGLDHCKNLNIIFFSSDEMNPQLNQHAINKSTKFQLEQLKFLHALRFDKAGNIKTCFPSILIQIERRTKETIFLCPSQPWDVLFCPWYFVLLYVAYHV